MKYSFTGIIKPFLLLLFLVSLNYAQGRGAIAGLVTDAETGETLIGVSIQLAGTNSGTTTDIDGKFQIRSLKEGRYSLKFSYLSYGSLRIDNIDVKNGGTAELNVQMKPESTMLNEVVISAEMLKNNESSILKIQKNSGIIMDAVSSELIKKNNSSDGTDVLKRMTGVAIADGKYAYIRGVSDRYNNTLLNGSSIPSTDPEKKSFSYDIFPSSLIENVMTAKTFTPDKPADFTGGLVQINTVEFPSGFFMNMSLSSSWNTKTTLRSFTTYKGGETDFLGIDDGTRSRPGEINDDKVVRGIYSDQQLASIASKFSNTWATTGMKAPVNFGYKLSLGNKYNMGSSSSLGLAGALTYSTGSETKDYEKSSATFDGPRYSYNGTSYSESVLLGALLNVSYKSELSKISLKNLFNQSSDNDVLINQGDYEYTSQYRKTTGLRFVSRSLYSSQLSGEHLFSSLNGSAINWNAGFSRSLRDEPDARQYVYARDISEPSQPMLFLLDPSWTTRFFGELDDRVFSLATDFTIRPFENKSFLSFKTGAFFDRKERTFDARIFGFRNMPGPGNKDSILALSVERIFQPENFNSRFIVVNEITKPSDSYSSDQTLSGAYIMFDAQPLDRLKVTGGLRYELFERSLLSSSETNQMVSLNPMDRDYLPALNLTYMPDEKINIRASFSRTLARPEFRELAPYSYYDFLTSENVKGNPSLKKTLVTNYDLRFEFYPGLGELFAFSFFYKDFTDPIEQIFVATSGFEAYRSFANISAARNYGLELEIRKNLGSFTPQLENLSFVGNFSWIKSRVSIADSLVFGFVKKDRPMQGQAEYIMNLGLYYDNQELGLSSSLVYNKVGDRITQVGFINVGDIIERPRDLVDFSVSKKFFSKLTLSLTAKDILSQDLIYIQRRPGKDVTEARYRKGKNYSFGISYSL